MTTYQKMRTTWARFAEIPKKYVFLHSCSCYVCMCWLRPGFPKLQYHQYPSFTDNSAIFLVAHRGESMYCIEDHSVSCSGCLGMHILCMEVSQHGVPMGTGFSKKSSKKDTILVLKAWFWGTFILEHLRIHLRMFIYRSLSHIMCQRRW